MDDRGPTAWVLIDGEALADPSDRGPAVWVLTDGEALA
jgi:hypothetical protein